MIPGKAVLPSSPIVGASLYDLFLFSGVLHSAAKLREQNRKI